MIFDFSKYSDNTAVVTEQGNTVSYREIDEICSRLAQNVKKRSLIFNLSANCMGSLIGYLMALKYGHVSLMLSEDINEKQINNYISIYQPEYIYVHQALSGRFSYPVIYTAHEYSLLSVSKKQTDMHDELALLLTTSGSTGSPKLVRQSYNNLAANTASIVEYLNITASERAITSLPMNYTYGLSVINSHLSRGASLFLTKATVMQRDFWAQMTQYSITSLAGVPFTYEMLKRLRFTSLALPDLKTLTQAGGKLSPDLHRVFAHYAKDNNKYFVVMYGAAEATARMAYLPSDKAIDKCGSIGKAIPGGEFALCDERGNLIAQEGEVGELIYWGDNVVLGYAECREDLQKGNEFQGRLSTGDMARFDSEGYYYVVGRKKRFLKIFGNRVGLDEVEVQLRDAFPDIHCACAGIDDKMYVFITDDSVSAQVKRFLVEQTQLNHIAFKIITLDSIPKNGAGKTLYSQLEAYYNAI
ncbi:AMP-binding protein [Candidatus Symbiopectobacterium sp.]|uniref:AMP-binding protein n=1 Tax=Candidatus Symbiopectobacterium sp. TaxID=2816440 RepID=UPI0025BFB9A4|nr:AMP-binding protein [Candidatus Symbiopectobacterium sp.]